MVSESRRKNIELEFNCCVNDIYNAYGGNKEKSVDFNNRSKITIEYFYQEKNSSHPYIYEPTQ